MSYSINEAKNERALDIECAIMTSNPDELLRLAHLEKKEGHDEKAEALLAMYDDVMEDIKEMQEELAYDDYKEERYTYYTETHMYPSEGNVY